MTAPDWVVRRDGSVSDVLTPAGTWGTMDEAQWFASQEEACAAPVPDGTTGTAIQVHPDTPE